MTPTIYAKFIKFLKEEMALPTDSIAVVQRTVEQYHGPIPMILWHYGNYLSTLTCSSLRSKSRALQAL